MARPRSSDGADAETGQVGMTPREDDDLEREIRAHLEQEADERIADGVPPDQARLAARRAFGNVTRVAETVHDMRRVLWLDDLVRDMRFACRQIRRTPGFAVAAIVTLALGIGVNTIAFTLLNSLALRPIQARDPGRIVRVYFLPSMGSGLRWPASRSSPVSS